MLVLLGNENKELQPIVPQSTSTLLICKFALIYLLLHYKLYVY